MQIFVTLIILLLIFALCARHFRSPLNPPGMHALSFGALLVFYMLLLEVIERGDLHLVRIEQIQSVLQVALLSSVCFALAWIGKRPVGRYLEIDSGAASIRNLANLKIWLLLESGLLILALVVAFAYLGVPIIAMLTGELDVWALQEQLPTLPVGVLATIVVLGYLLALQFAVLLTCRRHYPHLRMWLIPIFLLIVFSNVWQAKRQLFLITLIFLVLALVADSARARERMRLAFIFVIAATGLWLLFVAVQFVRAGGAGDGQVFWSEIFQAPLWALINLGNVLEYVQPEWTLRGLISQIVPHRFLGHGIDDVRDILFEPTASVSYVQYGYMDFGIPGVAAASFFFGLITRLISAIGVKGALQWQARLLVLWVCISAAMYSHPYSLSFFLLPALTLFMISVFGRQRAYQLA